MALTIHTEESEVYEVENQAADVADVTSEAIDEAAAPVADDQPEKEPEPEGISDAEDFRIQIWNAEMRCRGREAVVEDLKEQLKEAKAEYEQAVNALRKLANDGGRPLPLFDKQPSEHQQEATSQEVADDESWRGLNFAEFIKGAGIDGLGAKKMEALADAVPTFGDFEDLRTKASLENMHLCKLLPAGFGEKVTDQIEEAYLSYQWKDSIEVLDDDDEPNEAFDDGLEYEDADDL